VRAGNDSGRYDQACQFISTDIGRELDLARLNARGELGIPIAPGGGNLLAALGLLCYTEFAGKLRFGYKKANGADASKRNFLGLFDLLGPTYAALRSVARANRSSSDNCSACCSNCRSRLSHGRSVAPRSPPNKPGQRAGHSDCGWDGSVYT